MMGRVSTDIEKMRRISSGLRRFGALVGDLSSEISSYLADRESEVNLALTRMRADSNIQPSHRAICDDAYHAFSENADEVRSLLFNLAGSGDISSGNSYIERSISIMEEYCGINLDPVHSEYRGGSYGDIFTPGEGDKYEVHHMPADSINGLSRDEGPAIKMDKEDHRRTASCGNSKEAKEYRSMQQELIEQGRFMEAVQMDIDDIRENFGDKYDVAIQEMLDYIEGSNICEQN